MRYNGPSAVNQNTTFMLEIDKHPQLDERIWDAWIKKNEAQDKASFTRLQWIA
jgi:hypothetical protein